ncbi:MAG: VWA domain-containing protein [Bacteroidetes bacterium]|nr:MAG: VWA domain-containing protein [Bacteroidota bacterium]TAG86422.1 MAG: VWA domain-containing protein [Bacteroidota bacterium]
MFNWQWFYSWGTREYLFLILFLAGMFVYLRRLIFLAKELQKNPQNLWWKAPIRILTFLCLLVALLGPSFGFGQKSVQLIGKEIFFVLDLSTSMDATDVKPSRLEKIKYELKSLWQTLTNDRIGLIVFGQTAFLQCPLTNDKSALELFLQTIKTHLLPYPGTDFTPALTLAQKKLTNSQTIEGAKTIVLISDGENFGNTNLALLQNLKSQNLKVFCVGVGTIKGGLIPLLQGGYKYDRQGKLVQTKLNPSRLQEIARITGGEFFLLNDNQNDMPKLQKALAEIKGTQLENRILDVNANKYEYFLWVALALIILDIILIIKVL